MAPFGGVIQKVEELPADFSVKNLREMSLPRSILMCAPTYFDVLSVKNAFMEGQVGKVDRREALRQWRQLKHGFESKGILVAELEPLAGCEDMVFCANPVFPGVDGKGGRKCVLSRMNHPSRQREVAVVAGWFEGRGYELEHSVSRGAAFEGGGDAVWHLGRGLIWGGYGQRTEPEAYTLLAQIFDVPVITLKLADWRFYHLDTCFCAIDEETALIYPGAFTDEGLALINRLFPRVIQADEEEATVAFACNAAAFLGRYIFIQRGAINVCNSLRRLEYEVVEVETGEFLKSGGSVYCMKSALF